MFIYYELAEVQADAISYEIRLPIMRMRWLLITATLMGWWTFTHTEKINPTITD